MHNFSVLLEGVVLEGGWTVGPLRPRNPHLTGGNFSHSYTVFAADGRSAYLKAIDIFSPFTNGQEALTVAMQRITVLFNFERDLLEVCQNRNMDRVVRALASGFALVDSSNPYSQVPYLIFEAAEADIRGHLGKRSAELNAAWRLRSLHHIATGLKQLHGAGIAHQDLKPSNVLVFLVQELAAISKIADLGRASQLEFPSPYDRDLWAGDWNYAPPELHYGHVEPDWNRKRIGSDLYMLGSMISFIFTGVTASAMLFHKLQPAFLPSVWSGGYAEVLPYVQHAFVLAAEVFSDSIPPPLRTDLLPIYKQLCNPNPEERGAPRVPLNKVALERYVSRFSTMASKAEAGQYGAI